jgi:hypothetical protein
MFMACVPVALKGACVPVALKGACVPVVQHSAVSFGLTRHVANKKMAQLRTHYLTKESSYVSTQSSGQLNTFLCKSFQCLLESSLIVEYSRMNLFAMPRVTRVARWIACRCVCRTHESQDDSMTCLSNSQDDDSTLMCRSKSQDLV